MRRRDKLAVVIRDRCVTQRGDAEVIQPTANTLYSTQEKLGVMSITNTLKLLKTQYSNQQTNKHQQWRCEDTSAESNDVYMRLFPRFLVTKKIPGCKQTRAQAQLVEFQHKSAVANDCR